jgi:hypothetical protein
MGLSAIQPDLVGFRVAVRNDAMELRSAQVLGPVS